MLGILMMRLLQGDSEEMAKTLDIIRGFGSRLGLELNVGTKGVSQVYHLSFDDNKVLKIINWIC